MRHNGVFSSQPCPLTASSKVKDSYFSHVILERHHLGHHHGMQSVLTLASSSRREKGVGQSIRVFPNTPFLGGTPLCLTVTSSYNLDLNAGPSDPGDIINCTSEAPAST